jgi:hypothetical protein
MSLEQIRIAGIEALTRALGPVGMVRFLQQYETGSGDYTAERRKWLDDLTIEEIVEAIERRRFEAGARRPTPPS